LDLEASVAFRLAKRSGPVMRLKLRRWAEMGMGEAIWVGMVRPNQQSANGVGGSSKT